MTATMNAHVDAEYRFALARGFLTEAEQDFRTCLPKSQPKKP